MPRLSASDNKPLLQKAEAFCAYQERCTFEVTEKLKRLGASPKQIQEVLASLMANNFLNESRFAEAYAIGKLRIKHWGVNKIKQGLLRKKIEAHIIAEAINMMYSQEDYFAILNDLAQRKYKELFKEKDQWIRKQKLFRFLASRGFNYQEFSELKLEN